MPGSDPYPIIHNGDNGIGGYATTQAGAPSRWLSYLSVRDVDSAYKAALAAGAKSLMAPMDYGSAGRAATIVDPTGGVFSLWRGARATRPRARRRRRAAGSGTSSRPRTRRPRSPSTRRPSAFHTTR